MKKFYILLLILLPLLSSCQAPKAEEPPAPEITAPPGEMRAAWLCFYEFPCTEGKNSEEYSNETDGIFRSLASRGINTVFVHVRAFCDAFYPSSLFPVSRYAAGKSGVLPFDPFKIIIASAKKNGISIHAWINPFRVSLSSSPDSLPQNSPAKGFLVSGSTAAAVLKSGIYLNPASSEACRLILDGIREILDGYEVDGIHIDDYFYPETGTVIDRAEYESYRENGGQSSLEDWRRSVISAFVASACSLTHSANRIFSVSPAANLKRNYHELFADVETWLAEPGYADIIIPQIYYGFRNGTLPFESCASDWAGLKRDPSVRLVCGLAAYKCGKPDDGTRSGRNEWLESSDILARQVSFLRKSGEFSGFALFSAGSILSPENAAARAELDRIIPARNGNK